jgi:mannose-6-phosphate isomerase class I
MKYINFLSKYDRTPKIKISEENTITKTYKNIASKLANKKVLVFECYPGVRYKELEEELFSLIPHKLLIKVDDYAKSNEEVNKLFQSYLTQDRVFGVMNDLDVLDLYNEEQINNINGCIKDSTGPIIVYGFGASVIVEEGTVVYLDLARWEIQARYRSTEMSNWRMTDFNQDILRKYKRGYFIEWRIADRIKEQIFNNIDFYLDTNIKNKPKMITGTECRSAIEKAAKRPFRMVPYFDMGVWGGQWMKEVCNLDKSMPNYAWSFDGIPEENSVYYQFGEDYIESPAINIVLFASENLLGEKVTSKYGREFPIRFDLLDTVEGQNLSLQVHPVPHYIKEQFNMDYTQDESYYILHAEEKATVYLGLKDNVDQVKMFEDLRKAERGEIEFPAEKYVNQFPAKKHDHFLIPAGTIHCSGSNTMVLEISATPYIFTFKLWDWGRLGLDGVPRPVHVDHGQKVIQWDRTTKWVQDNLINNITLLEKNENYTIEKTGLHDLEPIETIRHFTNTKVTNKGTDSVHVINMIEGEEAIIESVDESFEPFVIHYAETIIIPASIKEYTIRPHGNSVGTKIGTIRAQIK